MRGLRCLIDLVWGVKAWLFYQHLSLGTGEFGGHFHPSSSLPVLRWISPCQGTFEQQDGLMRPRRLSCDETLFSMLAITSGSDSVDKARYMSDRV